jgi:hypothetical protein
VGDTIQVEGGKARLQFVEVLADGRQRWWLLDASGRMLEPHFSREAAAARAKRLIQEGRL